MSDILAMEINRFLRFQLGTLFICFQHFEGPAQFLTFHVQNFLTCSN